MRIRNNSNAPNELIKSGYLINEFPISINKNIIIELGMGKGEMLTQLALKNPTKKFIGVEKFPTIAAMAAKKAKALKLKNFLIVNEDIANLGEIFKGKVDVLWLTFSDPWPKARHEKRRLTYVSFLGSYKNLLSKKGVLKFKTDNDKLFEYSIDSFLTNGWNLSNVTRNLHAEKFSGDNIMTGYEQKWSSKGKNINYLEARR